MLDENLICFHVKADTAEDVLRAANKVFLEQGYVKESYLDAVIAREKVYPTGLPGERLNIALPHTDPEHILKPGIAILILEKPVEFLMMGTTDVTLSCDLVLPLAVVDPSEQIDALKKIMGVIQDSALLEKIMNSTDRKEVIALLDVLQSANKK